MACPPLSAVCVSALELARAIDTWTCDDEATGLVVAIALAGFELDMGKGIISPAEQERARRLLRAEDRLRFVLGRASLRSFLSRIVSKPAASLAFDVGVHGKLSLPGSIRFNLSHSGQWVAIGLHKSDEIGVDVEAIRPLSDWAMLAATYMGPAERSWIGEFPIQDRETAFLNAWTRKEAVTKALGRGLTLALASFEVFPINDNWKVTIAGDSPEHFSCFDLSLDEHHVGAVAIASEEARCTALMSSSTAALQLPLI
jgi:4'-phosphopantetheinyl transferase